MLTATGQLYTMGNSKDGKLGIDVGRDIIDVELPVPIKKGPKIYYQNKTLKTELRQYPLFEDYD